MRLKFERWGRCVTEGVFNGAQLSVMPDKRILLRTKDYFISNITKYGPFPNLTEPQKDNSIDITNIGIFNDLACDGYGYIDLPDDIIPNDFTTGDARKSIKWIEEKDYNGNSLWACPVCKHKQIFFKWYSKFVKEKGYGRLEDLEWISISDRLPKDMTEVMFWSCLPIFGYFKDDTFYSRDGIAYNVTHWMSLPTAPKNTI